MLDTLFRTVDRICAVLMVLGTPVLVWFIVANWHWV